MRRLFTTLTCTAAGWAGMAAGQDVTSQPAVTLGPPVAAKSGPIVRGQSADDGVNYSQWVAGTVEPSGDAVPPIAPLQVPAATQPVTAASTYPPPPPPPDNAASTGNYPDPLASPGQAAIKDKSKVHKSYFGEMFSGWGGNGPEGKCFESDHCFDYFATPVSNPFYFEDPRALTEVRPIFLFQTISNSNQVFRGGNTEFLGVQARVAITDQWSFVMNKLGGVWINPGGDSLVPSGSGFAEIWLGPKWTFVRNTESGTVAAAGVTFEIPTGPTNVAQDTGSLSIVPYITAAQNFGCTSYGSFNAMATLGFSFRADSERADYLYNSWHLDFDVGNQHRFYPLVELNWFYYTNNGGARTLSFEGQDLANFGATNVSGRNNLSIATGVRYKFSEAIQTGVSVQFPLTNVHDFQSFRLGLDVIFRY